MWTISKIEQYISDGIQENTHLDYKGADSLGKTDGKKKEISKDISAFANSDGGTIIYGVKEYDEKEKSHLPEKIDPINRVDFTKEWLEQVINSTVTPRIADIIITPINYGELKKNKVIYVVDIPKSNTAHQANDKRYYKRYNFESLMMDDWELKDIINRLNKTDIIITFEPRIDRLFLKKFLKDKSIFNLEIDIWAKNQGNIVAKYVDCFISGSSEISKYIIEPHTAIDESVTIYFSNIIERKISIKQDEYIINSEREAILPDTYRKIGFMKISSSFILENCKINIQIATDDKSKYITKTGIELIE